MDVSEALKGHRLCEKGVGLIEEIPGYTGRGTNPAVVDKLEWVTEARSATVVGTPYTLAEGGHANYWGQLAQRNCMRQLVKTGILGREVRPCLAGRSEPQGGAQDDPDQPPMVS